VISHQLISTVPGRPQCTLGHSYTDNERASFAISRDGECWDCGRMSEMDEAFVWLEGGFNLSVTQFKASPPAPASPNHDRQSLRELGSQLHFKPSLLVSPQLCRLLLQSQPITKSGNPHSVPSSSPLAAQEVHPPAPIAQFRS
jgi:hypothetical protein